MEEAALLAAAEAYHETSHRSEWVKLTESEVQDVLILPANAAAINGVEEARRFFESTTGAEIRYEKPVVGVSRSGDMGYSIANATFRSTMPDGLLVEDRLRDFHLWEKEDGEWKIAIDMWNSTLSIDELYHQMHGSGP
jgi:ketosteroid isomerase-like protein